MKRRALHTSFTDRFANVGNMPLLRACVDVTTGSYKVTSGNYPFEVMHANFKIVFQKQRTTALLIMPLCARGDMRM